MSQTPGDAFTGPYVNAGDMLALRFQIARMHSKRRAQARTSGGNKLTKLRGRGMDFAEVRAYQPGDDIRTIDWRVTARTNETHTKVFREERERPTVIVVDQTHTMFFGSRIRLKSVVACQAAAAAAWYALAENDRVGGFILDADQGEIHKPKHDANTVARFLTALAASNRSLNRASPRIDERTLSEQLMRLRRQVRSNFRLYVISDFLPFGDVWLDPLQSLAQHNAVTAVRITDPIEAELPGDDFYSVTDGTRRLQFDAGDSQLRSGYRQRFEDIDARLRARLTGAGIAYHNLSTSTLELGETEWL